MNVEIIKQASLEAIETQQPMSILFGKVTSTNPLKVKVGESLILQEKQLYLDSLVYDNEDVILIKQQGGQKYLVFSTIVKYVDNSEYEVGGVATDVDTTGWTTVTASAYDDVGQLTANGERLSWDSMTVAVPMGSVYKAKKNKKMQIEYNGKVVTARVTDCGNFGAGNKYTNRGLDLAPGIWKGAFGFKSTSSWGLRKVRYRYIT